MITLVPINPSENTLILLRLITSSHVVNISQNPSINGYSALIGMYFLILSCLFKSTSIVLVSKVILGGLKISIVVFKLFAPVFVISTSNVPKCGNNLSLTLT